METTQKVITPQQYVQLFKGNSPIIIYIKFDKSILLPTTYICIFCPTDFKKKSKKFGSQLNNL